MAPPDDSFLARMMRPTQSSASKTHDKAQVSERQPRAKPPESSKVEWPREEKPKAKPQVTKKTLTGRTPPSSSAGESKPAAPKPAASKPIPQKTGEAKAKVGAAPVSPRKSKTKDPAMAAAKLQVQKPPNTARELKTAEMPKSKPENPEIVQSRTVPPAAEEVIGDSTEAETVDWEAHKPAKPVVAQHVAAEPPITPATQEAIAPSQSTEPALPDTINEIPSVAREGDAKALESDLDAETIPEPKVDPEAGPTGAVISALAAEPTTAEEPVDEPAVEHISGAVAAPPASAVAAALAEPAPVPTKPAPSAADVVRQAAEREMAANEEAQTGEAGPAEPVVSEEEALTSAADIEPDKKSKKRREMLAARALTLPEAGIPAPPPAEEQMGTSFVELGPGDVLGGVESEGELLGKAVEEQNGKAEKIGREEGEEKETAELIDL